MTSFIHQITFLVVLIFLPEFTFASGPRQIRASRANQSVVVDGVLDEALWQSAEVADGFIQNKPTPGVNPSHPTEVRIIYDDDAIYIGAMMFDTAPDSILHQLTNRDNLDNADTFGFWISCFQDGINAFYFSVTPDAVQYDAQISAFGEDANWNAVWQCNTKITSLGWVAEFKIPYSALRFPDASEQIWDINFNRNIRRFREISYWHEVNPAIAGTVNQSGKLTNIHNIVPPIRLFFSPYISTYADKLINANNGDSPTQFSYNAGMDVKYGINEAFTLDVTLIPDFGQVQSDNNVLNLTPFEVFFEEQRQFFKEGTELFSKGDLFYTRRIGAVRNTSEISNNLSSGEYISNLDGTAQLLNATKISGRNRNGLGIGLLNAVTAPVNATIKDIDGNQREEQFTSLTNYNILVADQNLGNNSFISLINTNVLRNGSDYDANVTGTAFDIRSRNNTISFTGTGAFSQKFNTGNTATDHGFRQNVAISKISGNLTYSAGHSLTTKYFDPNDLGFQTISNVANANATIGYRIFKPFGRFNNMWSELSFNRSSLHQPSKFIGLNIAGEAGINTRKFTTYSLVFDFDPVSRNDFFEPRRDGRFFKIPTKRYFGGWISTDYRKPLALDVGAWYTRFDKDQWQNWNWRVSPRWRISDHLMLIYVYSKQNAFNQFGYASTADNGNIIFGERDVISHTNVFTANYIFTNRMGLSFRLRHYWSTVSYKRFYNLDDDGELTTEVDNWVQNGLSLGSYESFTTQDRSFNAFNIDMVYTWVFSPGSEIRVVWKHAIQSNENEIPSTFVDNFNYTLDQPQLTSFSIRFLYFIDYLNLKRKTKFIEN
jgi:hypothetical protein